MIFEPTGKGQNKLFAEAIQLAHVIKYADQRLASLDVDVKSGSALRVEIQTLGDRGLRYRHRFARKWSDWLHLAAIDAPRLKDSCGAGDWCTAGLIAKIATHGQHGLQECGAKGLRAALHYGQALAAWNCGFEGARGGMYAVARSAFDKQIAELLAGELAVLPEPTESSETENIVARPACPPRSPKRIRNRNRSKKAA